MKNSQTTQGKNSLADNMALIVMAIFVFLPFHALIVTWLGGVFSQPELFKLWKELLIALLVPGTIILLIRHREIRTYTLKSSLGIAIISYIALTLLRAGYGHTTGNVNLEAMTYGIIANLRYVVFFLIVFVIAQESKLLKKYWYKLILGPAAAVVAFALAQKYLLPIRFLEHFNYGADTIPAVQIVDSKEEYIRLQSSLKGPNPFGAYLIIVLSTLLALFNKLKSHRVVICLAGALTVFVLFYTYSRSALIGAVFSLFTWLLLGIKKKRTLYFVASVLTAISIITAGAIYSLKENDSIQNVVFHTDENSTSNSSTNQVRAEALKNGIRDIRATPFGIGTGSAGPASFRNDHPARIAENYFIQIGQEVGIFGLVLYIMITFIIGYRMYVRRHDDLARMLLASLAGITVINMFSHAWMDDTLSLLWWGLAGIAIASPGILKRKHENKKQT